MWIKYIEYVEGENEEKTNNELKSYTHENIHVQIGHKVKVGHTLCEVVDIIHYPADLEESYEVDIFVKIIKEFPDNYLRNLRPMEMIGLFLKNRAKRKENQTKK